MEKLIAKRTAIAYDTRSEDYSQKVEYLAQACWFDVFPFFLTIWSQNFSESLHWGNWYVERHKYPYLAVEMMISGSLEYRQAGVRHEARAGDIYLSHPGNTIFLNSCGTEKVRQKQLVIAGNNLPSVLENLNLSNTFLLRIPENARGKFNALFDRLGALLHEKSDPVANSSGTFELLATAAYVKQGMEVEHLPPEIAKMIISMYGGMEAGITISEIVKESNIAPATLNRMFRKYCGMSPKGYYDKMRFEMAANMLRSHKHRIKEIASRLGFSNALYFSAAFKRYFGVAPSEFERN